MKKVLILTNNSGGLSDFRGDLIRELAKTCEVVSCTPFDDHLTELQAYGTRLIETPMDRRGMDPAKDIALMHTYRSILRQEKPDLVITYTIKPNIYGGSVCREMKIPYAVNITGLGTAFEGNGPLRKMVTAMYRYALKKARVVFFENEANCRLFVEEGMARADQVHVLHGAGVNLEKFSPLPYPTEAAETRFLFMGRVMAEKGVDELFQAMRQLRSEGVPCSLDMLGSFEENYEPKIRQAEAEGWLRYHGYQSDVRPFIRDCHCFVLPSWHEGMANTNLECAASARPVITSDIPGCREAVVDGETGFTFPVKDAEALYQVMRRLAEMPPEAKEQMGLAGRRHMEKVFDKRKVV